MLRTAQQQRPVGAIQIAVNKPSGFYARRGKRVLDFVVASIAILSLLPLIGLIAFLLRLSIGRGVFFKQKRVGRDGQEFSCIKFRTMDHDRRVQDGRFDGYDRRTGHKTADDPRHTPVGRILRKYSLDEVPQLINVVRGEMSLVGPRPEMAAIATPEFIEHPRHWVRPGLTGPYQVSDLRLTGDLNRGLHSDAAYVGNVSLMGDIGLLVRTLSVVISGSGE